MIKSKELGQIKGSVTQKPHTGKIPVLATTHELLAELALTESFNLTHKPLCLIKEPDLSTPLLYQVLISDLAIADWEMQTWRPAPTAGNNAKLYSTIRLINAKLIGLESMYVVDPRATPKSFLPYEKFLFTYDQIEWTWAEGGFVVKGNW